MKGGASASTACRPVPRPARDVRWNESHLACLVHISWRRRTAQRSDVGERNGWHAKRTERRQLLLAERWPGTAHAAATLVVADAKASTAGVGWRASVDQVSTGLARRARAMAGAPGGHGRHRGHAPRWRRRAVLWGRAAPPTGRAVFRLSLWGGPVGHGCADASTSAYFQGLTVSALPQTSPRRARQRWPPRSRRRCAARACRCSPRRLAT